MHTCMSILSSYLTLSLLITVHIATRTRKPPDTAIFQNGRQNLTDFATPKDVCNIYNAVIHVLAYVHLSNKPENDSD